MRPASSPPPDASQGGPDLLETMRLGPGGVELLGLHLARLRASAEAWGYPYREASVLEAIRGAEASGGRGASREGDAEGAPSVWKLRLTLAPSGDASVEVSALDARPLATAAVWPEPFALAGSPLCVHKTTHRVHYEAPLRWAQAQGADEALLVNPEGGLVDGTWTSVWVRREGLLLTPPLAAGGLPGVYRAHLFASLPEASEASLVPSDLFTAEAVYLSNALRGLVRVRVLRA